jgi:hypothetical protein
MWTKIARHSCIVCKIDSGISDVLSPLHTHFWYQYLTLHSPETATKEVTHLRIVLEKKVPEVSPNKGVETTKHHRLVLERVD